MANKLPSVSIIIPCRNEEKYIGKCLDSLIKNNYPKDRLEILVYDGKSTDSTKNIVREYEKKYPFIKLKNNSKQFSAFALNKGIKESKGEIIIRCDAHSEYNENYIKKLVYWLEKDKSIGNVGGIWINKPANSSCKSKSIAYTLEHKFCVGPNRFRTGVKRAEEVDTVPFGAWRREIFDKIGFFNEQFLRAQDLEFNMRLKKAGYKILLDPEIKIYYYPRDSFSKLFKMMFQYGYWKNLVNRELKIISSFRQLVPPLFVLYLFFSIFVGFLFPPIWLLFLVYLFLCTVFSLEICFKRKDLKLFPFNFLTFLTCHIGYGLGYLNGLWDVWIIRKSDFGRWKSEITR